MKISTIIWIVAILFLYVYAKDTVMNVTGKVIGVFDSAKDKIDEMNESKNKISDVAEDIEDKINLTNTSETLGKIYDKISDRMKEKE